MGGGGDSGPRVLSEAMLGELFDSPLIGIVVSDLQGQVSAINNAMLAIVGYTRDEVLTPGFAWRALTPPDYAGVDARAIEQLTTTGLGELREKELIRKHGQRVPVLIGSKMLGDASGLCISFVLDLTDRKRVESALDHLRQEHTLDLRFRHLISAAPDAMVAVDERGTIVIVNEQVEHVFGYRRDELVGQPIEILIPEANHTAHRAHVARYFSDPRARTMGSGFELYGRRKDGSAFPIEVALSPVETDEGLLVSSAIRDVTQRRDAERQRARLAAIVDASDDAIVGKTLEGIVTSWNAGAERLFGYRAAEIVGRPLMTIVPPEREAEETDILQSLARGEVRRFETERLRRDGTRVEVSVTTSPIRDPEGNVVGIAKVARDITEIKRLTRELEAFSYSVAHDLRTPLRGVNGFAELLLEAYGTRLDEEGRGWLAEIKAGASRMAELIDGLLALARVTRTELRRERVDLGALGRAVAAQLAAAEPHRTVELVIERELLAELDPRLAQSLVDNLLRNAWKFTSRRPHARIEMGDTAGAFFVRDNGAGFDMQFAKKLFAPFQRLHASSEFPGTGVGLATVQRIVQRHGGQVWAEGVVDGGATFFFTLPGVWEKEIV